ncbi:DinB family protein [Viridibacillus sp. FSL E2-0187]|uniref:DinB family protein n=1 Tax=Viridibacillus TaxID=496496 RepID=UPI00187B75AD|nr:DinB family protein [Viridibacillus sp. JNUCC-6]QOV12080.1 DinB family protein [Viridibacillus sp. JNUCC-6]
MEQYLEQNKSIRDELLNTVSNLSDEQLNKEVEEGRWTIMQVLHHLHIIEDGVAKAILYTLKKGEKQSVKAKPIELTVDRTTKIEAPSFADPEAKFITLEEMKDKLKESRNTLLQVVSSSDKNQLKEKAYPQPIFGLMSLDQWVPFIGYHEKRHIEQIEELKEKL